MPTFRSRNTKEPKSLAPNFYPAAYMWPIVFSTMASDLAIVLVYAVKISLNIAIWPSAQYLLVPL